MVIIRAVFTNTEPTDKEVFQLNSLIAYYDYEKKEKLGFNVHYNTEKISDTRVWEKGFRKALEATKTDCEFLDMFIKIENTIEEGTLASRYKLCQECLEILEKELYE